LEKVSVNDDVAVFDLQAWQETGVIQGSEGGFNADVVKESDTFFEVVRCIIYHI
jgi:hypothetical protein